MRICKLNGCDKKYLAKGLCNYHYTRQRQGHSKCAVDGCVSFLKNDKYCSKHKKCGVEGCTADNYYAKGYCRNHYVMYVENKDSNRIGKSCNNKQCIKTTISNRDYCGKCQNKIDRGLDPNINYQSIHMQGDKNPRWSGGKSEYANHSSMKKTRLKKLELVGNKCEHCHIEKPSSKLEVHHLDKSKDNHNLDNLKLLCRKCHIGIYHKGDLKGEPCSGKDCKRGVYKNKSYCSVCQKALSKPVKTHPNYLGIAKEVGCSIGTVANQIKGIRISKKYGDRINELIAEV